MKKRTQGAAPAALALSALLCASFDATAGGIPFAGNRPQSYQFSTNFKEPYDSFGQFIQANDDSRAFNDKGEKVDGSGGQTYVGLSSRLHYFKFDSLPDWGWVASVTVPEVRVQGRNRSASGLGDPLVGGLAWTNPTPTTTVGFQAYVQAPIGNSSVTTNTWSFWPSVFADAWLGRVNIDLLVGGILRGTTHKDGVADIEPGDTRHANLRLGYSLSPPEDPFVIPFVAVDFQKTGKTRGAGGADIAGSDSRETALGLGVLFQLKPGAIHLWQNQKTYDQLSFHYSRGVSGKNTSLTNGLFAQYWHYW